MHNEKAPLTPGEKETKGLNIEETVGEEAIKIGESVEQRNDEALSAIEQELFIEGFIIVTSPDGRSKSLMNKDGKLLGGRLWNDVKPFHAGLARVRDGRKWGYIGKDGKLLGDKLWDWTNKFRDGCAIVSEGNKQFHINRLGMLIGDKGGWDTLGYFHFHSGFAVVEERGMKGRKKGFIDRQGKLIGNRLWDDVDIFGWREYAKVKEGYKVGYMNKDGELLGGRLRDDVKPFQLGYAEVRDGEKWGYIDTEGNWYDELPEEK